MYSWLIKTFVFVIRLNTSFIYLGRGVPTSLEICETSWEGMLFMCSDRCHRCGSFLVFTEVIRKLLRQLLPYGALLASAFLCQSPYWEPRGLCAGII